MKNILKRFLSWLFYITGISWLAFYVQFCLRKKALVLLYHQICNPQDPFQPAISPEVFDCQIRFIRRHFEIVPVSSLLQFLGGRRQNQKPLAVITFDDGYQDNYEAAFPILKKYEAPATIFLAAGSIGGGEPMWTSRVDALFQTASVNSLSLTTLPYTKKYELSDEDQRMRACYEIKTEMKQVPDAKRQRILQELEERIGEGSSSKSPAMLSWDQIREMEKDSLVEFGSHSVSHRMLAQLPPEEVPWELAESKRKIESGAGKPVRYLSYPGNSRNKWVRECAKKAGYEAAFAVDRTLCSSQSNRYEIQRVHIENEPLPVFLAEISLVIPFFRKLLGRNQWKP